MSNLIGPSIGADMDAYERWDGGYIRFQPMRPTCDCGCGKPIHPLAEGFSRECGMAIYLEEAVCGMESALVDGSWQYHDLMMGALLEIVEAA